jgi:predicted SnoaL-like aldol condensation-catalyzing enzyme
VTKAEIFNRYGEELWRQGDFSHAHELLTEDYVGHSGLRDRSVAGLLEDIELYRAHHPNLHVDVLDQFEVGDKLVTRVRVYSAGKVAHGINISRFAEGRIAEEWAVWTDFE